MKPIDEAHQLVSDFIEITDDLKQAKACARLYAKKQPWYCVAHKIYWEEVLAVIDLIEL